MDPETDFARSVSGSGQKDPDPKDWTNPSHIFAACVSAFCFKYQKWHILQHSRPKSTVRTGKRETILYICKYFNFCHLGTYSVYAVTQPNVLNERPNMGNKRDSTAGSWICFVSAEKVVHVINSFKGQCHEIFTSLFFCSHHGHVKASTHLALIFQRYSVPKVEFLALPGVVDTSKLKISLV